MPETQPLPATRIRCQFECPHFSKPTGYASIFDYKLYLFEKDQQGFRPMIYKKRRREYVEYFDYFNKGGPQPIFCEPLPDNPTEADLYGYRYNPSDGGKCDYPFEKNKIYYGYFSGKYLTKPEVYHLASHRNYVLVQFTVGNDATIRIPQSFFWWICLLQHVEDKFTNPDEVLTKMRKLYLSADYWDEFIGNNRNAVGRLKDDWDITGASAEEVKVREYLLTEESVNYLKIPDGDSVNFNYILSGIESALFEPHQWIIAATVGHNLFTIIQQAIRAKNTYTPLIWDGAWQQAKQDDIQCSEIRGSIYGLALAYDAIGESSVNRPLLSKRLEDHFYHVRRVPLTEEKVVAQYNMIFNVKQQEQPPNPFGITFLTFLTKDLENLKIVFGRDVDSNNEMLTWAKRINNTGFHAIDVKHRIRLVNLALGYFCDELVSFLASNYKVIYKKEIEILLKLGDPKQTGSYDYTKAVYATPGIKYPKVFDDFRMFEDPDKDFQSGTINLSGIAEFGMHTGHLWPFRKQNTPINGIVYYPKEKKRFPIAIFAHGDYKSSVNSTPGYEYLCKRLASRGVIAASIDCNFLNDENKVVNDNNKKKNDGRDIMLLEHVKQFQQWNKATGHPLHNKIDLNKVMLVGHSRGGEAAGIASLIHRVVYEEGKSFKFDKDTPPRKLDGSKGGLGPYNFTIQAIVAMAPTDLYRAPEHGPTKIHHNYLVIQGSRDNDAISFPGYKIFDRSHAVLLDEPKKPAQGLKALVWLEKGNHNYFNSVWENESKWVSYKKDKSWFDVKNDVLGQSDETKGRREQENVAAVYIIAFAEALLNKKLAYLEIFNSNIILSQLGWISSKTKMTTQYQSANRLFIQHFEENQSTLTVSKPVEGQIKLHRLAADRMFFGSAGINSTKDEELSHLHQETHGVQVKWNANQSEYQLILHPKTLAAAGFTQFSVNAGQSFENKREAMKDFKIFISDSNKTAIIRASEVAALHYPDTKIVFYGMYTLFASGEEGIREKPLQPKTVMQTIRIPFSYLKKQGLDINNLSSIKFEFDRGFDKDVDFPSTSEFVYMDKLQLSF